MENFDGVLEELENLLCRCAEGKYALAIAGSHAKGMSDPSSDIDLFLYAEDFKPYEERWNLVKELADEGKPMWVTRDARDAVWGGGMDFSFHGTPVETVLKRLPEMNQLVEDSLAGKFEIIPEDWTTNGYFTYICLSELNFVKPLKDPWGILAGYKEKVKAYPDALLRSIVERFWNRSGFWLDSFHYISAVKRADTLFTGPIMQHLILDLVQVLYAVNRAYYPGDKKLELQLSRLAYYPEKLLTHLEFFMSAPKDTERLALQREWMLEIRREIIGKFPEYFKK